MSPADPVQVQRRAVRGTAMSVINQAVKTVINTVIMLAAVLLLERSEVGLFGIAFAVQSLMVILRDGGLGNALIQRRDTTDIDASSVFWVNVLLGALLAAALLLTASTLAAWYDEPLLEPILRLVAIPVLVQSFGSVQEARLRKELRFARLLLADAGSLTLASAAALVAMLAGAGIWGLMIRLVAAPILLTVFCWVLSPWRPRLACRWTALRGLWSFGGFLFLTSLLGFAMTRLDVPIVGKLIGAAVAGSFFLARTLALTVVAEAITAVGRVMFSAFSLVQDDLATMRSGFLSATRILAVPAFPAIAALVAISPEFVLIVLPTKWSDTTLLIQIIALQGVLVALNSPAVQVLYARGRSRLQFTYALIVTPLIVLAYVLGARWGALGVALAWTVVRFTCAPVILWFATREIELRFCTALTNVTRPAAAAIVAGLAVRLLCLAWEAAGATPGYALLALEVIVGAVCYGALCFLLVPETLRKIRTDLVAAGVLRWARI